MKQIVVALDGSECSIEALNWAKELAGPLPEVTFHLVHAYELTIPVTASAHTVGPAVERIRLEGEGLLSGLCKMMPGVRTETYLKQGAAARQVLEVAEEVGADLIAVGRRGRSPAASLLLGSVSSDILRRAQGPVLVVHDAPPRSVGQVLAAVDGAEQSARARAFLDRWAPRAAVAERQVGQGPENDEAVLQEFRSGPYDLAVVGCHGREQISRLARRAVVVLK